MCKQWMKRGEDFPKKNVLVNYEIYSDSFIWSEVQFCTIYENEIEFARGKFDLNNSIVKTS